MHKRIIIGIIGVSSLIPACAHHQIIVSIPNPTGDKETVNSTVTAFQGGMHREVVDCDTNILTEVSIHQNLSQTLINVVTLGTVWPLEIEYQCGKPEIEELGSMDDGE